jgi:hypothetical protein
MDCRIKSGNDEIEMTKESLECANLPKRPLRMDHRIKSGGDAAGVPRDGPALSPPARAWKN